MDNYILKTVLVLAILFSGAGIFDFGLRAQENRDYLIAYNVLENEKADDYDIYIMRMDGSASSNLTKNPDVAWTYYSFGGKIFFVSDRNACRRCYFLYSMDADGNNIKKISDLRLEDSWMSSRNNGREFLVTGRIANEVRHQLFFIDAETGKFSRLTNEPDGRFRDPLFSPDGNKIVFVYRKIEQELKHTGEIFIMDVDGKNRKQLTRYPADDKSAGEHRYQAGPPRWNRKENFISYQSVQNGKSSLFAVTPDGKKTWKLTDNPANEGWHDWSPDGKWLAVEMWDSEDQIYGIHLMNWETKELKQLTDPKKSKYQQSPVFVELKLNHQAN